MWEETAEWKKSNSLYSVASILRNWKDAQYNMNTSEDKSVSWFPFETGKLTQVSIEMSIQGFVEISMCVEDQDNLGIYLQPHFKNRTF